MKESYTKQLVLSLKTQLDNNSYREVTKEFDKLSKVSLLDTKALQKNLDDFKRIVSEDEDLSIMKKILPEEQYNQFVERMAKAKELTYEIKQLQTAKDVGLSSGTFSEENLRTIDTKLKALKSVQKQNEDAQEAVEKASKKKSFSETISDEAKEGFEGFKDAYNEWLKDSKNMQSFGKNAFTSIKGKIINGLSKMISNIQESMKQLISDALEELSKMASYATDSAVYSSEASSMYQNYGLTGSDAYAMSKALSATGIGSIETLISDPLIQQNQELLENFQKQYEMAKTTYEHDVEVAKEYQQFQTEMSQLKQELQNEVIDFFMGNKETIITFLHTTISVLKALLTAVAAIVNIFSDSYERSSYERQQATADILGVSSSSSSTYNSSTNLNINNTFNGVDKSDQSSLANVGQLTYQQVITALKGGSI